MVEIGFLNKLAQIACDEAVARGADCADVSAGSGRGLSVEIRASAIKSCDARSGGGISVRAIRSGGTGWSTADKLTEESAAEAGRNAAALALVAAPDPDFIALPGPAESYPDVPGLADPALREIDIKTIIGYALANIDSALAACSDAVVEGGFSAGYEASALVNSNGISLARESSYVGGHTMVIVKRGDEVGSFYDFDSARVLPDFSPDGIGARAAEQAIKFLGARKVETGRMPIVFGPLASSSIFGAVAANADAENIQRGRSFMAGKLGERIGPDLLTITDDPLIPRGLSSRRSDYEGFASRPLVLVENGILRSYLYSSYTAGKAKVQNTGHGTRGGGAAHSNVIPKLGTVTSDEIVRSTPEGLYINMGGISPNSATGDVSDSVDFGLKIEGGELAYPVMSAMIGGSFFEMLANIDAISSDYREEPGMIMPTVRIMDVLVAGGR
jgi:PmbA protein